MNKKRIILIFVLIVVVIGIGVLFNMYIPSLMKTILDMHRGR